MSRSAVIRPDATASARVWRSRSAWSAWAAFPVAELPGVEVALLPVYPCLGPLPTQEDVAGRLHQPLARNFPLALIGVLAGPAIAAEHRRFGLLYLQEQRIGFVAAVHQDDPAMQPGISAIQCGHWESFRWCPRRTLRPGLSVASPPVLVRAMVGPALSGRFTPGRVMPHKRLTRESVPQITTVAGAST
jgi:hypothetical protein